MPISQLKHDAKKTLELLDKSGTSWDPFSEVFLKEQRDLPARFDTIIRFVLLPYIQLAAFSRFYLELIYPPPNLVLPPHTLSSTVVPMPMPYLLNWQQRYAEAWVIAQKQLLSSTGRLKSDQYHKHTRQIHLSSKLVSYLIRSTHRVL